MHHGSMPHKQLVNLDVLSLAAAEAAASTIGEKAKQGSHAISQPALPSFASLGNHQPTARGGKHASGCAINDSSLALLEPAALTGYKRKHNRYSGDSENPPQAISPRSADFKRKRRLELNRKAAQESRRRKKNFIEELEHNVLHLTQQNTEMKEQNKMLKQILQVSFHQQFWPALTAVENNICSHGIEDQIKIIEGSISKTKTENANLLLCLQTVLASKSSDAGLSMQQRNYTKAEVQHGNMQGMHHHLQQMVTQSLPLRQKQHWQNQYLSSHQQLLPQQLPQQHQCQFRTVINPCDFAPTQIHIEALVKINQEQ